MSPTGEASIKKTVKVCPKKVFLIWTQIVIGLLFLCSTVQIQINRLLCDGFCTCVRKLRGKGCTCIRVEDDASIGAEDEASNALWGGHTIDSRKVHLSTKPT